MLETDTGRFYWTAVDPQPGRNRTVSELPRGPVCRPLGVPNLETTSTPLGIDGAEPEMVLTRTVHHPLEPSRRVAGFTGHGIKCIC